MPRTPYPVALVVFDGLHEVHPTDVRSLEWETNVGYLADVLTVVLDNAALLSNYIAKEREVELYLGYAADPYLWDRSELVRVFAGAVDGVLPAFGQDTTVTVRARDHSRLLIDAEVDESFTNLTDAQFVAALAERAGLKAQVTETPAVVGAQENLTYMHRSAWEVIQTLAVRNGFVAYVTVDKLLYWGPRGGLGAVPLLGGALSAAAAAGSIGTWTYFDAPSDVLAVNFDDSALVPNKITIVRWKGLDLIPAGLGDGFVRGSYSDPSRLKAARGRIIERTIVSTTADTDQACEVEAQARLAELARPTITATATVEGDPRLVGDARLALAGRLGRLAGDYYIEAARHRYGTDGYTATLQLTSTRPDASEVYRQALYGQDLTPDEQAGLRAAVGGGPTCTGAPVDYAAAWPEYGGGIEALLLAAGVLPAGTDSRTLALAAHATCGPIAAAGMLKAYGIATDPGKLAKRGEQGDKDGSWWTGGGMAGPDSEVKLIGSQNLQARNLGRDIAEAIKRATACQPVIFDTAGTGEGGDNVGHYILASAYREADGRFFGGVTISNAMKRSGGNPWATVAEIESYGLGAIRSVIVADAAVAPAVTASSAANAQTRGAMGRASSDVQAVIRAGGWPEAQWDNAAAIVQAESGGKPRDVSPTGDYGLFQINLATWKGETCDFLGLPRGTSDTVVIERLFDPLTNSQMAYRIWKEVGHWGYPGGWATAAGLGLA